MLAILLLLASVRTQQNSSLDHAIQIVASCDRTEASRFNASSQAVRAACEWSGRVRGSACIRSTMESWLSEAATRSLVDSLSSKRGVELALHLDTLQGDAEKIRALVFMATALSRVLESDTASHVTAGERYLSAFAGALGRLVREAPCEVANLPILGYLADSSPGRVARSRLAVVAERANQCSPSVTAAWRYMEVKALRKEISPKRLAEHIADDLARGCLFCAVGLGEESLVEEWLPCPALETVLLRLIKASLRVDSLGLATLANGFGGDTPHWLVAAASEGLTAESWFTRVWAVRVLQEKQPKGASRCATPECSDVLTLHCLPRDQLISPDVVDGLWRACSDKGLVEFHLVLQHLEEID